MPDFCTASLFFANATSNALFVIFALVTTGGLFFFALYFLRYYEHFAHRSLERKYADLAIRPTPASGDVLVTYYTYHGFLVWFTQTPHQVVLSPRDARKLLGRLLRFNLTWGLVTYGSLFVIPFAILNYLGQRRSIASQLATRETPVVSIQYAGNDQETVGNPVNPEIQAPTRFQRFLGWIMALICVLFAIAGISALVRGEFKAAIGCVMLALVIGWSSRDWLVRNPDPS